MRFDLRHLAIGAGVVGLGIVGMAGPASAHTVNVAWRCETDGSVTFFAATYHSEDEEGLSGGIVVDGTIYSFTSFTDPLPGDVTGQKGYSAGDSEEGVTWQVASVPTLAAGVHSITTTSTGNVEEPWDETYPFEADISCAGGNANRRPIAVDDAASTAVGEAVDIHVLANDSDPDGTFLNPRIVTQGAHGTVTLDVNRGRFLTYTPEAGFVGTDTFTYQAVDRDGAPSEPATVTVTVGGTTACSPTDVPAGAFDDVSSGSPHAESIDCLSWWEIVEGRKDGSFGPSGPVTRAQMASFVARLLDAAGVELSNSPADAFTDDDESVHELAINQLAELGVIKGTTATTFAPGDHVSREQTASLIVRAYELASGTALPAGPDAFGDDDGSVHEANINKGASAGFVNGTEAGVFDPDSDVRRDQMASFLRRVLDRLVADGLATPPVS